MEDDTCYMCEGPSISREHAPPLCLFPTLTASGGKDLRRNLISVPSCNEHNSLSSKDDEYLRLILTTHLDGNEIAKAQLDGKVLRGIARRPNLAQTTFADAKFVRAHGQEVVAFPFDQVRLDRQRLREPASITTLVAASCSSASACVSHRFTGERHPKLTQLDALATKLFTDGERGENPD